MIFNPQLKNNSHTLYMKILATNNYFLIDYSSIDNLKR
ncbi:hypothetical protein XBKQ1_740012 [Xenorhabdus bovienii str. kraussei Quebec]|uniref:Uncharacterized protein n=1 Tax=Xenorhabdus bovienii str. kraussei Quebec TaxID=1398203 RepID=A0A077PM12_XENBV|nr:hypothetical protein XBKQ1_740012 [Xenorhabdus bovienii str. kraussei Quebec]